MAKKATERPAGELVVLTLLAAQVATDRKWKDGDVRELHELYRDALPMAAKMVDDAKAFLANPNVFLDLEPEPGDEAEGDAETPPE